MWFVNDSLKYMIIQIVLLYASFAVVDLFDKFLISKRKIQPLAYTFYTVVTGILLLLAWPWTYHALPAKFIFLNLLSGAYFGLAMFVFYKVLSRGEVSRVVPFVFGLVPVFDVLISLITGKSFLTPVELTAMALLIPGALLIAYRPGQYLRKYLGLTILSAFLNSSYNFLWQYGAQFGPSLNNLMWNRLGAAGAMLLLLLLPAARKRIFTKVKDVNQPSKASKLKNNIEENNTALPRKLLAWLKFKLVPQKKLTGFLFALKQIIGGLNFIFISYFLTIGKVPIVDGLAGFRYLFLFIFTLLLSFKFRYILDEEANSRAVKFKFAALSLIFLGTIVLFMGNL